MPLEEILKDFLNRRITIRRVFLELAHHVVGSVNDCCDWWWKRSSGRCDSCGSFPAEKHSEKCYNKK